MQIPLGRIVPVTASQEKVMQGGESQKLVELVANLQKSIVSLTSIKNKYISHKNTGNSRNSYDFKC